MNATLEVVMMPVSDTDKSLDFYRDKLGFVLDVDYAPTKDFRVVQLTPQGSSTSIQFGVGLTDAQPGSVQGLYPGADPRRADYSSFADFTDPDGNTWIIQERGRPNA